MVDSGNRYEFIILVHNVHKWKKRKKLISRIIKNFEKIKIKSAAVLVSALAPVYSKIMLNGYMETKWESDFEEFLGKLEKLNHIKGERWIVDVYKVIRPKKKKQSPTASAATPTC